MSKAKSGQQMLKTIYWLLNCGLIQLFDTVIVF